MENQTPHRQAPPPAAVPPGTPDDLIPYIHQQANILAADVTFAKPSPMHKIVVERVQLNPDPKGPDVYYHSQMKGLVVSGAGLAKIANTAGIIWDVGRCHRTDPRNNPNYCSFQAVGGVKKPDGSIVWCRAEADMDLDVEREAAAKIFKAKGKTGDALKAAVDNYILQKRQFMLRICESNARNRVIRKLLPIKPTYTPEELKRPFVTVRTVFEPDYQSDPAAKQVMMQVYAQAQFGIFGERVSNVTDIPATDEYFADTGALEPPAPESPPAQPPQKNPEIAEIEALAARKGYDLLALPKPLEQYSERALKAFKAKLEALPEKTRQPGEDDF